VIILAGGLKSKDVEMGWTDCRIESEVLGTEFRGWLRLGRRGQLGPPLGGGIADDEAFLVVVVVAGAEEEAVAGAPEKDLGAIHRPQESQRRVDGIDGRGRDAGQVVAVAAGIGGVEEAGEGLGQLLAVRRQGDEVAPELADALEAVD
jgi:hypothetical protein